MEQVNKKAFASVSMPNIIIPAKFAAINSPIPIPAAMMVFFPVKRERNSMRKRIITWNIAQHIDMSLSIVILPVHLLGFGMISHHQHFLIFIIVRIHRKYNSKSLSYCEEIRRLVSRE